jgi:hypothetical protein
MGRHIPTPVEKQGELIMLETIIHQKGEDFGVLMIKMEIMRILIRLNSSILYNLRDTIKELLHGDARTI